MVKPNRLFCVGHLKSYKKCICAHNKKTNIPIKKWEKDLSKHFPKEDIQIQEARERMLKH